MFGDYDGDGAVDFLRIQWKDSLSPVQDFLAPLSLVAQASSSAPVWGDAAARSTVAYRYAGAKLQAGGRAVPGSEGLAGTEHAVLEGMTGLPATK